MLNLQEMPLEEVERQLRAGVSRAVQEMGQIVLHFLLIGVKFELKAACSIMFPKFQK